MLGPYGTKGEVWRDLSILSLSFCHSVKNRMNGKEDLSTLCSKKIEIMNAVSVAK